MAGAPAGRIGGRNEGRASKETNQEGIEMDREHGSDVGSWSRRSFLAAGAWAAGIGGAISSASAGEGAGEGPAGAAGAFAGPPTPGAGKTRIRLVFSHHRQDEKGKQSEPGWPYLGYDHEATKRQILDRLVRSCPGCEFLPATAYTAEDARKLLEEDHDAADGWLAYMIGGWAGAAETIAASGKPTIFAGDLYGASGELLVITAAARRKGWKTCTVSSSRFEDVVAAVRCFETTKRLRSSTILVVGGDPGDLGKAIEAGFGTKVASVPFAEINAAWEKADRGRAGELADRWMRESLRVVEPSREEIVKSAAMYLALRGTLDARGAQAITMNCLGGVYSGQTHAYPCLAFFQLANDGLVGACEADIPSTFSMLVLGFLAGVPGYISDPVIDTAQNRVIYVHCVAPRKVFGPAGPENPYEIRSHAEDRKGASVRSLMPLGRMTTTLKFDAPGKQVVLHQARTVENVDDEKSCRTKLAAEVVGDIDRLFGEWDRWGWHRVTFYGDHRRTVEAFAALNGFTVVREA
jgi:hypothetical protein